MGNQFNFKYTACTEEERKEIHSIRSQYAPKEQRESKIDRIRRLDALVKSSATAWSLVLGVVGILIFGLGLTMVLEWSKIFWGIVLMIIGCAPMLMAFPVYKTLLNKNKQRYGEEILRLSDELLNESEN